MSESPKKKEMSTAEKKKEIKRKEVVDNFFGVKVKVADLLADLKGAMLETISHNIHFNYFKLDEMLNKYQKNENELTQIIGDLDSLLKKNFNQSIGITTLLGKGTVLIRTHTNYTWSETSAHFGWSETKLRNAVKVYELTKQYPRFLYSTASVTTLVTNHSNLEASRKGID